MSQTKQCKTCERELALTEFHVHIGRKDGLRASCKKCRTEEGRKRYLEKKERILELNKNYYNEHKDKMKEYHENYRSIHKEEVTKRTVRWARNKRINDAQFRLEGNLRRRLSHALKVTSRSQTTKELLGISFNTYIKWIEYQLPIGYTINDVGQTLHIDHVIPLSSFNLLDEEQLREACNWINLQPLEAAKNRRKSNKIDPWLLVCQEIKATYFLKHLN